MRRLSVDTLLADFKLSYDDGVPIVRVKGDININNVDAFKAVVDCAKMSGCSEIVVALTMTEYVCRRGYQILMALQRELERAGRRLCVSCDPNCRPRRTMALLAVPFGVFDDVRDAIAALRRNSSRSKRA